jgi:branched-chain amino acid transport system permease protein
MIGILLERLAITPQNVASVGVEREKVLVTLILITIGAAEFIKGGVMLLWGKEPLGIPPIYGEKPIVLWGAYINPQVIWVIIITLSVLVLIQFFLFYTLSGKAMRASSDNQIYARLVGIDSDIMAMSSFALSAASGAIAGFVITPITFMEYDGGLMFALKGFCGAVIGGFGNVIGAIIGGFILGILESLGAGLISSGYKDAIAFIVLILILRLKPSGILGAKL